MIFYYFIVSVYFFDKPIYCPANILRIFESRIPVLFVLVVWLNPYKVLKGDRPLLFFKNYLCKPVSFIILQM